MTTTLIIFHCRQLQENLIRSHSAGVGHPLPPEKTRMLLALRINVLAKGHSGISWKTLMQLVDAFNGKKQKQFKYFFKKWILNHIIHISLYIQHPVYHGCQNKAPLVLVEILHLSLIWPLD